jgi:hypothetical protein
MSGEGCTLSKIVGARGLRFRRLGGGGEEIGCWKVLAACMNPVVDEG